MGMSEKYYSKLRPSEREKVIKENRKNKMDGMIKQKPVKNYHTEHGAYGRTLPRRGL